MEKDLERPVWDAAAPLGEEVGVREAYRYEGSFTLFRMTQIRGLGATDTAETSREGSTSLPLSLP